MAKHPKILDIKTIFLHGNLDEEVHVVQPKGFIRSGEENKICKLNEEIYDLKQAAIGYGISKFVNHLKNRVLNKQLLILVSSRKL